MRPFGLPISPRNALLLCAGAICAVAGAAPAGAAGTGLVEFRIEGNAINTPLAADAANAQRGRDVVLSRESGNCFLCHALPDPGETQVGNIGPPLAGVGSRLDAAQLRLRLVDSTRINPTTIMPPYYRTTGLNHVAPSLKDKPMLTAQQVEDVIAYLLTLR